MELLRGQKIKLSDFCHINGSFTIQIISRSEFSSEYDISCFGLDSNDKCSDDRYMIFYNQKSSPCKSIKILDTNLLNSQTFEIDISKLPTFIKTIVFTMTVDSNENMSNLKEGSISLIQNGKSKFIYNFTGNDFKQEKSIMIAEIYLKDDWKFNAKGIGFNGGLSSLLEYFGIEEATNDTIISNISENSIQEENNISFSKFVKNILLSPLKFTENKISQMRENERKRIEQINELNRKNAEEQELLNIKIQNQHKFKHLLIDYLSDGVLTELEMRGLENFCNQNNLDLLDSLKQCQHEIDSFIRLMLADIVSDLVITIQEEETIKSVCKFLRPSIYIINEIETTIKRVKEIVQIKSGNIIPLQSPKIITKLSEIVWYCDSNTRLSRQLKKESNLYNGELFITSDRILFKSQEYPTEITLKNIIDLDISTTSIFIIGKTNKSTLHFRSPDSEKIGAYIEQALNKYHRKLDFSDSNKKTRSIPQTVRQEVWLRDEGKCVECSAQDYLEYDHIIPYSKGGSNSSNNIQLLCRKCNLKKSDRI